MSLNPCSNGIPSDTAKVTELENYFSLNPCSNGIPSDGENREEGIAIEKS